MTDYKKIADMMQAMPVSNETHTKAEFEAIMKKRGLTFKQDIDTVNDTKREVWGNKNFEVIVLHSNNSYKIL